MRKEIEIRNFNCDCSLFIITEYSLYRRERGIDSYFKNHSDISTQTS